MSPRSAEWRDVLANAAHDFYHLPGYLELSSRTTDHGEPAGLLIAEGQRRILLPIVLRSIEGAAQLDARTPYGYPGPIATVADPGFLADAALAIPAVLRERGIVSLFARLHPLLNPDSDCAALSRAGTVVQHGETVVIDLNVSLAELWRQTQSGHRNEINRSMRAGHRAYFDEDWERLNEFILLYRETMGRVAAGECYYFERPYFLGLREALGDSLRLCVVEIEREVAAAGLFTECAGIVQYHLSGSAERFAKERPTKLMLHHARTWARMRGNRWMHLGGGLGAAQDSLFAFKAGFSKQRLPFHTWRLVTDEEAYRALVCARDPSSTATDRTGYFPEYRRPASS